MSPGAQIRRCAARIERMSLIEMRMSDQTALLHGSEPTLEPQLASKEPVSLTAIGQPVALTVIAVVVVLHALYFAASLLVPIAAAVLLSMLLGTLVRLLERLRIPRALGSAIVVVAAVGALAAGIAALSGPAQIWIDKAPESMRLLEQRLFVNRSPLEGIKKVTDQLQAATQAEVERGTQKVRVMQPALTDLALSGTPRVVASIISVIILVYFLLASGDAFLRKLVSVVPTLHDKKRAVEITRQVETDISFYLLNFTLLNAALGAIMVVVTAYLGLPNPLLWGVLVAVLNFVPYVGAITSMAILAMAGVQTFDSLPQALAAPAVLVFLVIASAAVVTPYVLGRRLLLNPVAIFLSILLWGWLWGIVGVLLAVPLLASFKIVCERVEPLHPVAEFLTT